MAEARAGTGTSAATDPVRAAIEATAAARACMDLSGTGTACDLALVLAAGPVGSLLEALVRAVAEVSGAATVVGAAVEAVASDQEPVLSTQQAAVLLTGDTRCVAGIGRDLGKDPAGAAHSLARALLRGEPPRVGPCLALVDASTFRARPFLDALDAALPPGTTVLGGSPTPGVPALLAAGGEVHRCHDAALAVQLRGTTATWGLTQGWRPTGSLHLVTAGEHRRIDRLDDRPALEVLGDPEDVLLAVALGGPGGRPVFRYHGITAVDPASGAVFLSRGIAVGARVGVTRPDPDGQRRDRHDMLGDLRRRAGTRPTFGLLVGQVAAEAPAALAAAFPELPFVGWRSHTTLGSVEGRPEVLAHAELVGVFR